MTFTLEELNLLLDSLNAAFYEVEAEGTGEVSRQDKINKIALRVEEEIAKLSKINGIS